MGAPWSLVHGAPLQSFWRYLSPPPPPTQCSIMVDMLCSAAHTARQIQYPHHSSRAELLSQLTLTILSNAICRTPPPPPPSAPPTQLRPSLVGTLPAAPVVPTFDAPSFALHSRPEASQVWLNPREGLGAIPRQTKFPAAMRDSHSVDSNHRVTARGLCPSQV